MARQEIAEVADAAIELRLGRTQRQAMGDRSESRFAPRCGHDALRHSAPHVCAEKHGVLAAALAGGLLHGKALSGQHGLADEEVVRIDDRGVRRNEAPGSEKNDVAGHDFFDGNLTRGAVAQYVRARSDARLEHRRGGGGSVFTEIADARADQNDGDDDDGIDPLPGHAGDHGGEDEEKQQRTPELAEQHTRARQLLVIAKLVSPVLTEPALRLGRSQTGRLSLHAFPDQTAEV
jgi:hypothetical protein